MISGRLRAHPYPAYQKGPSTVRRAFDEALASLVSDAAKYRGRSTQRLFAELQRVANALEDARALTWSPDLSDTFGRAQSRLNRLMSEVDDGAHHETGSRVWTSRRAGARPASGRNDASAVTGDWPYLAF